MHEPDDGSDGTDANVGTDSYRTRYQEDRDAPSLALVEAIAAMKAVDETDLEPLGASVDMDALDALLDGEGSDCTVELAIPSHGVVATLESEGTIELRTTAPDAAGPDAP